MSSIVLALPLRSAARQGTTANAGLTIGVLAAMILIGQPALSESPMDCAMAEATVRQRVMPLLRRTDSATATAVRNGIAAARVARAHCLSGQNERALRLYGRIITGLDPLISGPDRDLADEFRR
jgi:hypothetical protein